jgi:hypothetical protein
MRRAILHIALGTATAVSAVAAWRELSCQACAGGGLPLGILGTAFYACALIATAVFGLRRAIAVALFGAFGLHAGLVLLMLTRGPVCVTCLAAAGASGVVVATILLRERELLDPALAIAPWAAAGAFLLPLHPAVREVDVPSTPGAPVQVAIFTRDGCPYCVQLRDEVLPEALAGLDGKVELRWREAPPGTPAPSIVLSRADRPGGRLIEGLPPAGFLRREIDKLLTVQP